MKKAVLFILSVIVPVASGFASYTELTDFFSGAEVRYPGSPGNLAVEEKVAQRFAQSGFPHGAIRFEAPGLVPGRTVLRTERTGPVSLYPMYPSLLRPGNFKQNEFQAELIYLGKGTTEDLHRAEGSSLEGALVLMEFDSGQNWMHFLRFGVKGFIFIGGRDYLNSEAVAKLYASEVPVPRFLVRQEQGERLRELAGDRGVAVSVSAEPTRWQKTGLRDLWVFIPGNDKDLEKEVVIFTAPLDSSCIVPELAQGAHSGANLFLLLKMLEDFRETPPERSVLLAAVNAHTQNYHGERLLAWHLLADTEGVESIRNLLTKDARVEEIIRDCYQSIDLSSGADPEDVLLELRTKVDKSTEKDIILKEPVVLLAKGDVNNIKVEQVNLLYSDMPEARKEKRRQELEEAKWRHINVLTLFNKAGNKTEWGGLDEAERNILRKYFKRIIERYHDWFGLNKQAMEIDLANGRVREVLAGRRVSLVITLDIGWQNRTLGFLSGVTGAAKSWANRFGINSSLLAEGLDAGHGVKLIDSLSRVGGMGEEYYFLDVAAADYGLRYFHATQTPALCLKNVFVDHGRVFTPADSFSRLDPSLVEGISNYVVELVRSVLSERTITASDQLDMPKPLFPLRAIQLKAFKFDEFSASVIPEIPVPDSVIMLADQGVKFYPVINGDVINGFSLLTDNRAGGVIYGLARNSYASSAFHFCPDFKTVDHTIDAGIVTLRFPSNLSALRKKHILPMFACQEFAIWERNDSSRVSAGPIMVNKYIVLSAERNSEPRKYGSVGAASLSDKWVPAVAGPAAVYLEKDKSLKVLTDQKRLAIQAVDEAPEGIGYKHGEGWGADFFATAARDMSRLNKYRLKKMKGVNDELARDFIQSGDQAMAGAEAAQRGRSHLSYLRQVYEALGAQVKAYSRITNLTNDMLKAIVLYMALLLPFCFFIQKLLFKFTGVEAQMGAFAALFMAVFFVFRYIHPAFNVARFAPAIFIAFVMVALGVFVIQILHSRFEGEMQLLFRSYLGMDSSSISHSTAGQQAMMIGVNNMKRRRIRTTLTTGTIVLVTFALLTFSSVSKRMSPTVIEVSDDPAYSGLMYHWPGNSRMDEGSLRVFLDLFSAQADVFVRRWILPDKPLALHLGGRRAQINAVLGLSAKEDGFLAPMPVLSGGRFFSSDDAWEAVITLSMARALKLTSQDVGQVKLDFRGHQFTLVGILDDQQLMEIRDLNNWLILPIQKSEKQGTETAGAEMDVGKVAEEVQDDTGIIYVQTSSLLFLPEETSRQLGAQPFSVSLKFKDDTAIWSVVEKMLKATTAKFFVASKKAFRTGESDDQSLRATAAGTYYIGSGYKTSIGGLARLLIPIIIAGTIILNTMLGSVYERKYEIAVYNAVGLNPTHIGLFFLAEAFVYGVIGSVGGYMIGQSLAMLLVKVGLFSDLNLNFSSLMVVYVILFTLAIVLLSTLYPASVATRTAVPSGKRRWTMPDHDGEQMKVIFPFIYSTDQVVGIMAYLEDFFSIYTEASMGELVAKPLGRELRKDAKGRKIIGLKYNLALAPFDLGVTQDVVFLAAFDEVVNCYRIFLDIKRISGQDSNWVVTNKPFLEKLRKYLMYWRNLAPSERMVFVKRAEGLYKAEGKKGKRRIVNSEL